MHTAVGASTWAHCMPSSTSTSLITWLIVVMASQGSQETTVLQASLTWGRLAVKSDTTEEMRPLGSARPMSMPKTLLRSSHSTVSVRHALPQHTTVASTSHRTSDAISPMPASPAKMAAAAVPTTLPAITKMKLTTRASRSFSAK